MPEELARLLKEAQDKSAEAIRLRKAYEQMRDTMHAAEWALKQSEETANQAWNAVQRTGIDLVLKEKKIA